MTPSGGSIKPYIKSRSSAGRSKRPVGCVLGILNNAKVSDMIVLLDNNSPIAVKAMVIWRSGLYKPQAHTGGVTIVEFLVAGVRSR